MKGEVEQRKRRNAFPLLIICLNTQSLHVQLCPNMSTDSFLNQLAHFMSIRGKTSYIYCDMGSQLCAASKGLSEPATGERPTMDWSEVRKRTASSGIKWTHAPAQAQWRDGRSEAMVKALKRTLHHMNTQGALSFSELACLLS